MAMLKANGKALFYFMAFVIPHQLSSQSANQPVCARYAGMAGTSVVLHDAWSGFRNQAGLAYVTDISLSAHYQNPFILPENSTKALAIGIPVMKGTIGLDYSLFGYTHFFESRTGLAFGKKFGNRLSAGIQINYLMIHQSADYGNMHALVPEGGMLAQPLDKLYIGFHIFNPVQQHYPQHHEQMIPAVLQVGLGYFITDNVFLSVEAEKEKKEKQVIKAGFEYRMIRCFALRLGVSTAEISRYAMGIGYSFKRIDLDFAVSRHPQLGLTPYVTLAYVVRDE